MVRVSLANPSDLDDLLTLLMDRDKTMSVRKGPTFWRRILKEGISGKMVLVAKDGSRMVGTCHLSRFIWLASPNPYLQLLWVPSDERRRGIASLIIAKAEQIARRNGSNALYSSTGANNLPSLALHRKLGFTKCGMIQLGQEREVFLRKPLR